jgi:hypothetical protein
MSTLNFSYDFVTQMQAAQYIQVTQTASSSANDPLNFPYSDPTDWSSETSFDTSIPTNPDGSIDVDALLEKMRKIAYYAQQGDPMDFNSMLDLTALMMKIGQVWPQLQAQGGASKVSQFLNLPVDSSGTTLAQLLANDAIPAIIYGTFYKNGGNADATQQFANQLIATLKNLSGNASFLDPLAQAAETLGNPQALSGWMSDPQNRADMSFEDYTLTATLKWENDFTLPTATPATPYSYMDAWRGEEIDGIMNDPEVKKNPFAAYIMIMYILMNENGDIQTQIGGRGALMNAMTNLGNIAAKMNSQWSAGNFTQDSAKAFYQEIMNLTGLSKDNRFAKSIGPQIQQVLNDLTGSGSQINVTFMDGGKSVTIPLGQLFQGIQSGQYSWQNMADGLDSLQPSSTTPITPGQPTPPIPPGFATLSNDLGQITTSVTSASSAQGQEIQAEEGLSEKDLSFISAGINAIINVDKVIIQNYSTAGN